MKEEGESGRMINEEGWREGMGEMIREGRDGGREEESEGTVIGVREWREC